MSISQEELFDSALSLPQAERADLAFQLLQTLHPPGDEIPAEEFQAQLHDRITAYKRGEIASVSLDEAREAMRRRLTEGGTS
jgi:putative addiction module component (TIGR02574 family)